MDWGAAPLSFAGAFVVLRQQEGLHLFLESQFNGQKQGVRGPLLRPFSLREWARWWCVSVNGGFVCMWEVEEVAAGADIEHWR